MLGRGLLLTSPWLVPDGCAVFLETDAIARIAQGRTLPAAPLAFSRAGSGGGLWFSCLVQLLSGAGSVIPSKSLLSDSISGLPAIACWLQARTEKAQLEGVPLLFPSREQRCFILFGWLCRAGGEAMG